MRLLAIETSCDETAVSIVESEGTPTSATFHVLGNALYSQASKHADYGGVYPSLAKREHAANLVPLLHSALTESRLRKDDPSAVTKQDAEYLEKLLVREDALYRSLLRYVTEHGAPEIDAIAVTQGPGLEPALWVGINFARALAHLWHLPIIPVNHLEGHILASAAVGDESTRTYTVHDITFPVLGLILSGGHTEFVRAASWGEYQVVGSTRDDSIGEAFDKVARLLDIPYPGGPVLSDLASRWRSAQINSMAQGMTLFPRPMLHSEDIDFSFSGLKTAVLYHVRERGALSDRQKEEIAAEFEEAVADVVCTKIVRALAVYPTRTFLVGGGVSANKYLRKRIAALFGSVSGTVLALPATGLSTDNAIMIGMAGYFMHLRGANKLEAHDPLVAHGTLSMEAKT